MKKLNAEWHKKNPMPKNPTLDQRVDWHIEHAKNCACRKAPESILRAIESRRRSSDS